MAGPGDKGEFDYVVQLDSSGNVVGSSGGGTSSTDDGAFTPGSSSVTPMGAVYQATPDNVDDNDVGAVRMSQARVLLVDASGATVPISHAALTELAAAINASSQMDVNIAASGATVPVSNAGLTELAAAIDTEVQVDIVGSLPAGTNGIGKLTANSGVDIGDVDVTSIVLPRNLIGPGQPGTAIDSYTHASFNLAAGADQVLVSSAASKQIWVYGIGFTVNVAGTVSFQDEDNTAITGVMQIGATGGMVVAPSGNFSMPIWKLGTDKDLEVDVVTSELDGWIDYAIVSV